MRSRSAAFRGAPALLVVMLALLPACDRVELPGVTDLSGHATNPFADTSVKATVALFVDTECPVSNRYAPEVRRLYEKYADRGVAFWLVYPNPDLSADAIRAHLQAYDYPMPALRDPEHALVALANAQITPEAGVFVPDRRLVYHGRIDDRFVDFGKQRPEPTRRDLDETLAAVLEDRPIESAWNPAAGRPIGGSSVAGVGCFISDLK